MKPLSTEDEQLLINQVKTTKGYGALNKLMVPYVWLGLEGNIPKTGTSTHRYEALFGFMSDVFDAYVDYPNYNGIPYFALDSLPQFGLDADDAIPFPMAQLELIKYIRNHKFQEIEVD